MVEMVVLLSLYNSNVVFRLTVPLMSVSNGEPKPFHVIKQLIQTIGMRVYRVHSFFENSNPNGFFLSFHFPRSGIYFTFFFFRRFPFPMRLFSGRSSQQCYSAYLWWCNAYLMRRNSFRFCLKITKANEENVSKTDLGQTFGYCICIMLLNHKKHHRSVYTYFHDYGSIHRVGSFSVVLFLTFFSVYCLSFDDLMNSMTMLNASFPFGLQQMA